MIKTTNPSFRMDADNFAELHARPTPADGANPGQYEVSLTSDFSESGTAFWTFDVEAAEEASMFFEMLAMEMRALHRAGRE
jgi:hypothetical protein